MQGISKSSELASTAEGSAGLTSPQVSPRTSEAMSESQSPREFGTRRKSVAVHDHGSRRKSTVGLTNPHEPGGRRKSLANPTQLAATRRQSRVGNFMRPLAAPEEAKE